MKKLFPIGISLLFVAALFFGVSYQTEKPISKVERKEIKVTQAGKKKTPEERALFSEARILHEYYMQVNPLTGEIPRAEKILEFENAKSSQTTQNRSTRAVQTNYISRGPSNLGGRTRKVTQDISDGTGNTMLGCGVSGGVFRTTNGGTSWTKVSANDEIHNATTIVQDPRSGFQNIWYYGTGEGSGNSASPSQSSAATIYWGNGIWKSTDSGLTWTQMPSTASTQELWNSRFDTVWALAVHPTTGDLYAAINGRVSRFNGTTWESEVSNPGTGLGFTNYTDVAITSSGRVYASFSGNQDSTIEGIWTSANGDTGWSRINAASFTPAGRVVLTLAPSNQDKLYTLFVNGNTASCVGPVQEVDLWMWDQGATSWTDYTSKLPDETPCNSGTAGNVPMAVFNGYCMDINVKPDDEDFVVIGGTNVYRKSDITAAGNFDRIGGYNSPSNYAIYNVGGTEHHPDIHDLSFDIADPDRIISGTDGGIHEADVTAGSVAWTNLNNDYQTFQFYHVGIDPLSGSDLLVGGAQDNGTNYGGTAAGLADLTNQKRIWGGDGVASEISRDEASVPTFLGSQNGNFWRVKNYVDASPVNDIESFIAPSGSTSSFVTYFYLDPDNNNALYYAGQNRLYRTTDASNTTTAVNTSNWTNLGTSTNIDATHADYFKTFSTTRGTYNASTSYLLMGGDEGHIYRLDDPQNATGITSAIDITPSTATIGFPSIVTGLAIHPTNKDIVLATYANYGTNSIYLSTNASTATPTWTLVERNLSAHSIRSAVITEVGGETLYFVGTARGLYSTTNPASIDWTREAPSQLGYAVISSLRYRPADNKLLVGTHGNGVYEATVTSTLSLNGVDDISDQIKLYPNPAKNKISIEIANNYDDISYQISNLIGQRISNGTIN
ncbi:MAG: hypothetical protein KUG51_00925, partial [Urechidicola sp.]|nr:hypothetical protein [Urechidicola sp.]